MEVKITSKNVKAAGNKIIITKQQEETLTMHDLENVKMGIIRQKNQIIQQMNALKEQYESYIVQENEVNDMIAQLSGTQEELPTIQTE